MNTSILFTLRDEISLEGLEGITFDALWIRMKERVKFLSEQNTTSQLFTSNQLDLVAFRNVLFNLTLNEAKNDNIKFYELPSDRPPLVIYNRNDNYIEESGTIIVDDENFPEDIYSPIVAVQDGPIRGSCSNYSTRKDITLKILNSKLKTIVRFGKEFNINRVVMVASPKLRAVALMGQTKYNSCFDMKVELYIILESIGRKRWYGEINAGKSAPKFQDSKIKLSYAYYRKMLNQQGLIVQYVTYLYYPKRKKCTSSSILFLPRLKPLYVNPVDWKAIKVSEIFIERSTNKIPFSEIKECSYFQKTYSKKIKDFLCKYPHIFVVGRFDGENKEIIVEYLKPLNRRLTSNDLYDNKISNTNSQDEDLNDNEEDSADITVNSETADLINGKETSNNTESNNINAIYPLTNDDRFLLKIRQLRRYFIDRIYQLVERSETRGIPQSTLSSICHVPQLYIRQALKFLKAMNLVSYKIQQEGRQQVYYFISNRNSLPPSESSSIEIFNKSLNSRSQIRIELILEYLRKIRYTDNPMNIRRFISENEANLPFKVDIKSIFRLLNMLIEVNFIKVWHYHLSCGSFYRTAVFIFYNNFDLSSSTNGSSNQIGQTTQLNETLKHLLLKSKFLNFSLLPVDLEADVKIQSLLTSSGKIQVSSQLSQMSSSLASENADQVMTNGNSSDKLSENLYPAFRPSMSYRYRGLQSKIDKAFELYRYLFFLLVDSVEYYSFDDWRCRVPKLSKIFPDRQCLFGDVLIYMPLSVFMNVVNIRFLIPGLDSLLDDPIEHHKMLYKLSPNIRRHLLHSRKIVHELNELMTLLSKFNLLSIHNNNEVIKTESISFRLNTTLVVSQGESSKEYKFMTIQDFDRYVNDVNSHLFHTVNQCSPCPYNPSINIHSVDMIGSKHYTNIKSEFEKDDEKFSIHQLKRKQNLKAIRSLKRMKSESGVLKIKPQKKGKSNKTIVPKEPKQLPTKNNKQKNISFRTTWSREEDHFLLKCRIASLLLDPVNRYQLCVPPSVVCELLHSHIGEASLNKDSNSCCRRLLRFNRKAHIKRIISYCLLELDHIDTVEMINNANIETDNKESSLIIAFKQMLNIVLQHKFTNTEFFLSTKDLKSSIEENCLTPVNLNIDLKSDNFVENSNVSVQESLDTLLENYTFVNPYNVQSRGYYLEPKNYYDIHSYVITNVLVSSLLSLKYHQSYLNPSSSARKVCKRFFMRTVFKTLKHFPDTLVKLVVKRLVKFEIIMHNRTKPTTTEIADLTNPNQSPRTTPFAYSISKSFLIKLNQFELLYDQMNMPEVLTSATKREQIISNKNSMYTVLQFAENLSSNFLGLFNIMPNSSPDTDPNSISDSNIKKFANGIPYPPSVMTGVDFKIEIPENFIKVPNTSNNFSTNESDLSRRMSRCLLMTRNSKSGFDSTLRDDDSIQCSDDGSKGRFKLALKRNDDMVVNHCKVHIVQTYDFEPGMISSKILDLLQFHLRIFDPSQFSNMSSTSVLPYTLDNSSIVTENFIKGLHVKQLKMLTDRNTILGLIEFIKTKNELGVKLTHIIDHILFFEKSSLSETEENDLIQFLTHCEQHNLLFCVGILERTWVHRDFVRFWMVHSYDNLEDLFVSNELGLPPKAKKRRLSESEQVEIKPICFLPKVWKLPNGRLDSNLLFTFLNRLIGYLVMVRTTVNLDTLAQHFESLISPVQLHELLEMLLVADCVRKSSTTVSSSANHQLPVKSFDDFFRTPDQLAEYTSTQMELADQAKLVTLYEANIDCYSRLSTLYYAIKEHQFDY